jgi:serine/threonine protein kinase/tetratricopeptide (TPR) repeat protein
MADQLERLKAALADRYQIERELGSGGMATVYLAQDLKHERQVAVKVLRPELAAALGSERFLREIQIAANLNHPHIVPLHDSGESDGSLYYVMPYVEGETLRDRIEVEGQLPLEDALQIAREIASALSYAHSHDVIHRDIKPENVLLSAGEAVVADFGIARAITEAGGEHLTETGISIGTPAYMSPEQASGEHKLDGRSDIYSLGCILYEMLVGDPPFAASTPQAIIARKVAESVPSLRVVRETVPETVEDVVMRMLAKTPADRQTTALQLAEELKLCMSTPGKAKVTPDTGSWLRRRVVPYGVFSGAAALLLYALFTLLPVRSAPMAINSVAVLPFANLSEGSESDYFSDGITEDILTQLSRIGDLRVIPILATRQYKNTDKGPRTIGQELKTDALLTGSVRRTADQLRVTCRLIDSETEVQIWASTYNRTMQDVFAIQTEVARQIAEALAIELSSAELEGIERRQTASLDAYDFYLRGRDYYYRYRRHDNESAIELFKRALALDSTYALALAGLADAYAQRPVRYGFPFTWVDSALTLSKQAIALDGGSAEAHKAMGLAYVYKGQYRRGVEAYRQAVELNPNYFSAATNAGAIYMYLGEFDQALRWLKHSVGLNPTHFRTYHNIGEAYRLLDDPVEAVSWYQALDEDAAGLARLYVAQGNDAQAMAQIEKVLAPAAESASALEVAGEIAHYTGAFSDAEQYFRQSIANHDAIETDPYSISSIGLGHILWLEGRTEEARPLLDRSRVLRERRIAEGNEEHFPRYELAAISAIQGDRAAAYRWLRNAISAGWRDYRLASRDPWLESLREDDEFQNLMAEVKSMVDEMRTRIKEAG